MLVETAEDALAVIERFLAFCEDGAELERLLGNGAPASMVLIDRYEAGRLAALALGSIWGGPVGLTDMRVHDMYQAREPRRGKRQGSRRRNVKT